MKKILLVSGHKSGHNACRATGVNEGDLNIELVNMLAPLLRDYAAVTVYPIQRDMYKDNLNKCCQVNLAAFDYIFEIHFNAGGGRGVSVQLHSNYRGGISVEQAVVDNVAAIGFRKRGENGIVRRSALLNMNIALRLGVDYALIETCFYDSADMELYKTNKSRVAGAIAKGIIDAFGLTSSAGGSGVKTDTATVIGCTALNVRVTPNGKEVTTIKGGSTVEIIGAGKDSDGDTWHKIRQGSVTGYVWPKYIG